MLLALLGLILVGGRSVLHLEREQGDPIMARFAGLDRLPSPRSVSYWLQTLRKEHGDRLAQVHHELVGDVLKRSRGRRLTLDIDGSVVSAGTKVEGARRGYNPRRRGALSYWPITAYEAQEGQIVRLMNRPGNVHDGAATVDFIAALIEQVRAAVGRRRKLECRMDSAFFRDDVLEVLDGASVGYAVKVPFQPWLGLKQLAAQASWRRVDDRTSYGEVRMTLWGRERRIVLYRSHLPRRSSRNYQLDLFHPDCGHYAYSAIATNKTLTPRSLRHFLNGRGSHEKAHGELKSGFAFDCLPSLSEPANAAWQMLSVLAFNLSRSFQNETAAQGRNTGRKRRASRRFETIHTLRYKLIGRAAVLLRPAGKTTLHLGASPAVAKHFLSIAQAIRT